MNRRTLLKSLPLAMAPALPAAAAASKKSRLRTAICAYSYRDPLGKKTMTYRDIVDIAVDTGVDGLDLTVYWFPSTGKDFLLPLKRHAFTNGVEIYSISVRSDMCRPTAEERAKEFASLKNWIDVAATLGAGHIRVFGGAVPKGRTEDEASEWVVETLGMSAMYAATEGVILGLENHGGITARADTIKKIVTKVNSPWVGVNVDTGNFESDAYSQLTTIIPYAVNVQVKTEIRVEKGKNEPSDWDRVAKMLVESGYKGYLALEYEAREDPIKAMPGLLAKLNAVARKYSA